MLLSGGLKRHGSSCLLVGAVVCGLPTCAQGSPVARFLEVIASSCGFLCCIVSRNLLLVSGNKVPGSCSGPRNVGRGEREEGRLRGGGAGGWGLRRRTLSSEGGLRFSPLRCFLSFAGGNCSPWGSVESGSGR